MNMKRVATLTQQTLALQDEAELREGVEHIQGELDPEEVEVQGVARIQGQLDLEEAEVQEGVTHVQ